MLAEFVVFFKSGSLKGLFNHNLLGVIEVIRKMNVGEVNSGAVPDSQKVAFKQIHQFICYFY